MTPSAINILAQDTHWGDVLYETLRSFNYIIISMTPIKAPIEYCEHLILNVNVITLFHGLNLSLNQILEQYNKNRFRKCIQIKCHLDLISFDKFEYEWIIIMTNII